MNSFSIIPLIRTYAVEHPIGLLDKIKLQQTSVPMPIPTANGDHVDSYSQFIRSSAWDRKRDN